MPTSKSDRAPSEILFAQVKSGHEPESSAAFAKLYTRWVGPLSDFCRYRGIPSGEREWVATECLLRALDKQDLFEDKGPESFRRWLFKLTRNYVIDYLKGRPYTGGSPPSDSLNTQITDTHPSPEQALEQREVGEIAQRLFDLAKLNRLERTVMALSIEQYPPNEIARITKMAVDKIYRLKYRAKAKVQAVEGLTKILAGC